MTETKKSLNTILAALALVALAILPLVFFVESRDTVGFLSWIFLFAAVVSAQPTPVPVESRTSFHQSR